MNEQALMAKMYLREYQFIGLICLSSQVYAIVCPFGEYSLLSTFPIVDPLWKESTGYQSIIRKTFPCFVNSMEVASLLWNIHVRINPALHWHITACDQGPHFMSVSLPEFTPQSLGYRGLYRYSIRRFVIVLKPWTLVAKTFISPWNLQATRQPPGHLDNLTLTRSLETHEVPH